MQVVAGTLRINNKPAMLEFVKAYFGLGLFPEFVSRRALCEGTVVEILPNEPKPELALTPRATTYRKADQAN